MKKYFLFVLFIIVSNIETQAQIRKSDIKYGDFYPAASDQMLIKKGYKDLVDDVIFWRKYHFSHDKRFTYSRPSGFDNKNIRDFVSVNPSSEYNRSMNIEGLDGIFLDPNNLDHWIVTIVATGEWFIVGCLNQGVKKKEIYIININTEKFNDVLTDAVTTTNTNIDYLKKTSSDYPIVIKNCIEYYLKKYPARFYQYFRDNNIDENSLYIWKSGFSLRAFKGLPGKEKRTLLKCLTGKTGAGRNIVAVTGGTLLGAGGIYFLIKALRASIGDTIIDHGPSGY